MLTRLQLVAVSAWLVAFGLPASLAHGPGNHRFVMSVAGPPNPADGGSTARATTPVVPAAGDVVWGRHEHRVAAGGTRSEPGVSSAVGPLTVDRIFASREFDGEPFGPARWLADGSGYATVERAPGGGQEIVRYEPATGRRDVLVTAAMLTPAGRTASLPIEDYAWSADGRLVLVFTDGQRVWRQNTRGDFWVLDRRAGTLTRLGRDAPPASLMFAKLSPDGTKAGYVHANDLYVEDLASGEVTRLTADGSRTLINGTFDWVYEEEFGCRDGWRWSPDGRAIAYWQLDSSGVKDFLLINNTDRLYPVVKPIPYPKPGETNSAARVGVVSAVGGATRWFDIHGDPRDQYLPRIEWVPDSSEVVVQRLNRLQNRLDLLAADAATGRVRTILTDRDDAWVEVIEDFRWLDGGRRLLWVSARDGWRHVYTSARNGQETVLVTPGDYDVVRVLGVDETEGWLYFSASPDQPTARFLYRARLDGRGKAERVTPIGEAGTHAYQVSTDARWAIRTHSRLDLPRAIDLVSLPDHRSVRWLSENAALRAAVAALPRRPVEYFRLDLGDGLVVDGWALKPSRMEPGRRYPLLVYVYGEPAGQTVADAWGGSRYLWHLMLAERGYIVVSVDNHGTPAPRGRAWRKCVYRQVGILASADQAAAVRAMGTWPDVDAGRVGVWGWSGGGSMTLNALFRYPELYHVGVSVAAVPDQHLYDSIYQERYMARPSDNPEGYVQGSPITFAHQLKGQLLVVHGTGDDNVHYQGFERLVNALVKANKPFTMMAYPNRSHGISEGENTTRHLYSLMTAFIEHHLVPGPR
jgi:dipeptidyl-peptidase-4